MKFDQIEKLVSYVMSKANECYSDEFPITEIEKWIRGFFETQNLTCGNCEKVALFKAREELRKESGFYLYAPSNQSKRSKREDMEGPSHLPDKVFPEKNCGFP